MNRFIPALILLLLGSVANADTQICDEGLVNGLALERALATIDAAEFDAVATQAIAEMPALAPVQKQATAPVGSSQGAGGAPGPERPSWISFAVEQGYATPGDDGSVTISLSPFDWLERGQEVGYFDQSDNFHDTLGLRKWTASLTLGSPGIAMDTDQDGVAEDPATVKSLTDSALLEVQYLLKGSNDRRDIAPSPDSPAYRTAISQAREAFAEVQNLEFQLRNEVTAAVDSFGPESNDVKVVAGSQKCEAAIEGIKNKYLALPQWSVDRGAMIAAMVRQSDALRQLANVIDKQAVISLSLSLLDRKDYLGPDRIGVSLRSRKGVIDGATGHTHKFNLDLSQEDSLVMGQSDLKAATLTYEFLRPATHFMGKELNGATWAVNISGERNWNAPAAAKKSKAVLGVALNVPVNDAVTIPFSLTWANRDEFLKGNDEIVGHVGVSFNFDAFKPN